MPAGGEDVGPGFNVKRATKGRARATTDAWAQVTTKRTTPPPGVTPRDWLLTTPIFGTPTIGGKKGLRTWKLHIDKNGVPTITGRA